MNKRTNPPTSLYFRSFFRNLLQDWEEEREKDSSLASAEDLTKRLWGNCDGWTPYFDLTMASNVTPDNIIYAIENYIAEFHNRDAWDVMDAWVKNFEGKANLEHPDLSEVIETFESVIYCESRPDLDF